MTDLQDEIDRALQQEQFKQGNSGHIFSQGINANMNNAVKHNGIALLEMYLGSGFDVRAVAANHKHLAHLTTEAAEAYAQTLASLDGTPEEDTIAEIVIAKLLHQ